MRHNVVHECKALWGECSLIQANFIDETRVKTVAMADCPGRAALPVSAGYLTFSSKDQYAALQQRCAKEK